MKPRALTYTEMVNGGRQQMDEDEHAREQELQHPHVSAVKAVNSLRPIPASICRTAHSWRCFFSLAVTLFRVMATQGAVDDRWWRELECS